LRSLKKGNITTSAPESLKEYTILLVGETGTGKTTLLSFFAHVLQGRAPDKYELAHDQSIEAGGGEGQSHTQTAKLYEFKSENGIKVRILDTPGLGDTHGIRRDPEHKKAIANIIRKSIPTINAVIILANGTVPRLRVASEYALESLSSMFGGTLAQNIAILFTNVRDQLARNFEEDSLPKGLRGDNYHPFWINNPVALWKKYKAMPSAADADDEIKGLIRTSHERAITELVRFFAWVDKLEPQSTQDIPNV